MFPPPLSVTRQREIPLPHISPQLRTLFDGSHKFMICMLDRAGRIVGWNLSAENLTGYSARDVLRKKYSLLFSKDDVRHGVVMRVLTTTERTGQCVTEGIRIKKDRSQFWARSVIVPVLKPDGKPGFFAVISWDITEQKNQEQKKEEYIGIASHELRTPITTLSLYSELLAKRLELDRNKENLQMLRDIQGQAARLTSLVDDLMVVGKIESGLLELHKEQFDIHQLLKQITNNFRVSVTSHRVVFLGTGKCEVRADKNRIAQVVVNLLTNAVKYSPKANKVIIHTRVRAGKCVVGVQDFGSGIAKTEHRKIFRRYFRSSDMVAGNVVGSGLGLYISQSIIKKHRERLWLKSAPKKGSTFFFTLPLVPVRYSAKRTHARAHNPRA